MKRCAVFTFAGLLVCALAASAEATGRPGWPGRHRPEPRVSAFWGAPGFAVSFIAPGSWYPPRRAYRRPRTVWVPGYWEKTRVWVPGRYERLYGPRDRHRPERHDRYACRDRHDGRRDRWFPKRGGRHRYR